MKTSHKIFFEDSRRMTTVPSGSVHLVVTSPPYPMIEMWDELFCNQDDRIVGALKREHGHEAFEWMHRVLDPVWQEIQRVLVDGGIACINVGDAARTIGGSFGLYPNHARILTALIKAGFSALPLILWRKPTNAPTKFMGSGMLPVGAYVTLEHEYILILRKGPKREFKGAAEKQKRRESALFWEERNAWFSDVWLGLTGTPQNMTDTPARRRSAAFPFELPYCLINMFSVKGDTVLDPFLGTGTTMWSAMAAARNSIGFEIDTGFRNALVSEKNKIVETSNRRIQNRIQNHLEYLLNRSNDPGKFKYINAHYHFAVMTRQEVELGFNRLQTVRQSGENSFEVIYAEVSDEDFSGDCEEAMPPFKKSQVPPS